MMRRAIGTKLGAAGLLLLPLAGCGSSKDEVAGDPIDCRLATARQFERICTIERIAGPDGQVIVASGPDGGFRRFLRVKDGRGVIAADGAEPVKVSAADASHINVAIGDMVYRLPARVAP